MYNICMFYGVGRNIHMRPQQMMSNDGEKLLNLWYLPHSTEVCCTSKHFYRHSYIPLIIVLLQAVTMFSTLPCHTVVNSLETVLVGILRC